MLTRKLALNLAAPFTASLASGLTRIVLTRTFASHLAGRHAHPVSAFARSLTISFAAAFRRCLTVGFTMPQARQLARLLTRYFARLLAISLAPHLTGRLAGALTHFLAYRFAPELA